MVNIKESIRTFREKFQQQGIELTKAFDSLTGDAVSQVHYSRNWEGEKPLLIEQGNCHHVPFGGIKLSMQSGRKVLLFDSNTFSEFGGTFGIDFKEVGESSDIEGQEDMSCGPQWGDLINVRIKSCNIIWLDDDGWEVPRLINERQVMVPMDKSMGIFPHGIRIEFENERKIYILAVEPDEYYEAEGRFTYLRGGEEFVIAFNEQAARNQKLVIEGIELGFE